MKLRVTITALITAMLVFAAATGNIRWTQLRSGDRQGSTGTKGLSATGSFTSGNCVKTDASGNAVDSGLACSAATGGTGLVLLETHTASASASLAFTSCLSSSYDEYQIHFVNIIPATSTANVGFRMSTDGGSSYDSGNNYSWTQWAWTASATGNSGATDTNLAVIAFTAATTANWSINGVYTLANPGGANYKLIYGQGNYRDTNRTGNTVEGETNSASYNSTTAVNAFQVIASSGNITSGIVRCYGFAR
jgi:hypothetical protein